MPDCDGWLAFKLSEPGVMNNGCTLIPGTVRIDNRQVIRKTELILIGITQLCQQTIQITAAQAEL